MRLSNRTLAIACTAALAAALPAAAADDLTIVYKVTAGPGAGSTFTNYWGKERARIGNADSEQILEYTANRITTIDHKRKEYSQFTLEEMEAALQKMNADMEKQQAQLQEQMKNLPPQVRDAMAEKMGGVFGAVTVTKGGTRKVAGYDTQEYVITVGETVKNSTWNTTALQFPAANFDFRRFAGTANPLASMSGGSMGGRGMAKMQEEMKKIQGFPLADSMSIRILGKGNESGKEAVEVKTGAIPDSAFALPAGYKKVDSPFAKMMKK